MINHFEISTPSESSISSSSSSALSNSFRDNDHVFLATLIKGGNICSNKYRPDHHHIKDLVPLSRRRRFRSRKRPSVSAAAGSSNVSARPWDRLRLWLACFSLMDSHDHDLSVHVTLGNRNKKFSGHEKRKELKKMSKHEVKVRGYSDRLDGSALSTPNSLPLKVPQMKELLLSELAMVDNEISRLESQINQLKTEGGHKREVRMESNSRGAPKTHHKSSPLPMNSNEKSTFEIKSLHFISKAIKGDHHKKSDCFTPNEKASKPTRFSMRKSPILKTPSPLREPRHPTPLRDKRGSEMPPKPLSTPLHTGGENRWPPNKLSENIMKCLIFIFVRLLRTSRVMELEKSGPVSQSTSFYLSFQAEGGPNSKLGLVFQKNSRQQDPYGIFDSEGSIVRHIGPYKNLVRFNSSSMDPKCVKNLSSVSLFGKLKVLMDGLQEADLRFLSHQQKLAFWINIYNACIMHGFLQYGVPSDSSPEKMLALINKATLNIAGNTINAQAIECFILRKPDDSTHREIYGKNTKKEMIVYQLYGLETPDPNIAFALCCGTRSSPAVKIYTADSVTAELERSKLEYLQAAIVVTNTKKMAIPELLLRNNIILNLAQDDGNMLVEWLCRQLPASGSLRKSMVDCFRGGGEVVEKIIPYDFEFQYLLPI